MKALLSILESIPLLANLFSGWIELQKAKLPMQIDKHNERSEYREADAKADTEKREDRAEIADFKRDEMKPVKKEKISNRAKRRLKKVSSKIRGRFKNKNK